ncbi:glucose-1-phosphate thymidylyltransferase [Adhaeribacter aerolatus]|uniref:Glucose-1-phosphate thymidylyltransferase n=1 Tax=Adhaeribacter aerolatus TaxID=670289 RepID=A0A512AVY2_9BACT|nr:DapH/DapD/GlmU-related protein [Adhaeribacter aerolatus]GEO03871.1 glucose-1-phosphate thymidylyltransferase [Adhaeribacter aerolatus]
MIVINSFIEGFSSLLPNHGNLLPWEITNNLKNILSEKIVNLGTEYAINDNVAVHQTAVMEQGVVLKGPAIIGPHCFVGAHAYFREGVFLADSVKIGPGCEIKNSIICANTAIAHFNYIGNSIIGRNINFEAGSIAANHYNERAIKNISVVYDSKVINTGSDKFGSLVGDGSKIGANAVLSPGTILGKNSVVKRLELVEQYKTSS